MNLGVFVAAMVQFWQGRLAFPADTMSGAGGWIMICPEFHKNEGRHG